MTERKTLSDFFTRSSANEGRRLPLTLLNGDSTEEWLHVLGTESDAFQKASGKYRYELAKLIAREREEEKPADTDKREELSLEMVASLVAGWSFDEECTHENVRLMLVEAPHIAKAVDRIASDNTAFFGPPSEG